MARGILFFIAAVLCLSHYSYAQKTKKAQTIRTQCVKGVVYAEEDNTPMIGVAIVVKGTTKGVATNNDGEFSIPVNKGDILIISSLGFEKQEYKIVDNSDIEIYLESNVESLEQVTVVGYGVQEKRDLTGSVSTIKGVELDKTTINFDNALAGKIPGVQVLSSSGAPGSATSITIRGLTSLSANSNNPLIVIDGVPIYGVDRSENTVSFERSSVKATGMGGTSVTDNLENNLEFENNPLAMLNLNDIESVEVLKDAYSTAIYGSRGAAGVILITTKKGSSKTRINANLATTISSPVNTPSQLNASQYSKFYNEYYDGNYYPVGKETNWLDEVLTTGVTNNANLSISAGTKKLKSYSSLSYVKQGAYILNQDYEKFSIRSNLEYRFTPKFKAILNASYGYTDNSGLNAPQIYRNAVLKAPNVPVKTEDGTYYFGYEPNISGMINNPVAQAVKDVNYARDNRLTGNAYLQYKPFTWITLKTEIGIDDVHSKTFSRIISRPDIVGGSATLGISDKTKYVTNNTATFVHVFDKHAINSVVGQSFEKSYHSSTYIFGSKFSSDDIMDINKAGVITNDDEEVITEWALFSAFFRLNYQYNNRYLVGLTYRVDGSSRFNKNHRYIGFPSFSLGWRLSEERFLHNRKWLDECKLRGSVGFIGIDGTSGYYGNQGHYELLRLGGKEIKYADNSILEIVQPNNPNLEWERTRTIDLGLDVVLWKQRVDFTIDYYHKITKNMLYSSAVPWYEGYATQQQNIGNMKNEGIEFLLSVVNIKKSNFRWATNLNVSKNTNKILKLNFGGSSVTGAELGYKYFAEGEPAGQFFLYDWAGVDSQSGNPIWRLPDGTLTETPPQTMENPYQYRVPMGNGLPDFGGGITNVFTYKNLKIEALCSFAYGNKLYNGTKALLHTYTTSEVNNLSTEIMDYWLIDGHKTDVPKMNNASIISYGNSVIDYISGRDSDRFLEDASYIRLKYISFTYQLPSRWLKNNFLSNASIAIQANNLVTITNYSGLDPELNAFGSSALLSGYDELTLPQSKSFSIGVNLGF
nr:TonB-dependent receptor [uncultured Draconibacterium sp.]